MVGPLSIQFKAVYRPNNVIYLGGDMFYGLQNRKDIPELMDFISTRVAHHTAKYKFAPESLHHIIISFLPIKVNIINKYRVDTKNNSTELTNFVKENFNRIAIPYSVNPQLLGGK